jgi:regulator of nucleoside diphosphate kinase
MQFPDPMRPSITLGRDEHRQLLIVAMSAMGHTADDSDYLHHELDRAAVVADRSLPRDIARVGSRVTYRADGGRPRTVTLSYPDEANPTLGRLSVMSPVGAALIGLRPGQSITRMGWDGAFARFSVISVIPPDDRN